MIPMTTQGFVQLQKELRHLVTVERPAIISEIVRARQFGDLSENAEYHAAREKQRYVEKRIQDIESRLSNAQVIDISNLSGPRIVFGATVVLFNEDKKEYSAYQIVGVDEADLKEKKLGIDSVLARELIGKEEGMTIEVSTLSGEKVYRIERVHYGANPLEVI